LLKVVLYTWYTVHSSLIYNTYTSWPWSYGSWIYNYLCHQCLLPLKLRVRTPFVASCTHY